MATAIIPKTNATPGSATGPSASILREGELATNKYTGRLYLKLEAGTVAELGAPSVTSVAGKTGVVTLAIGDITGLQAELDSKSEGSTVPTQTSATGDGTTTTFAVSGYTTTDVNAYLVKLNGLVQKGGSAYTMSGGNIVFSSAPGAGVEIDILAYQTPITNSGFLYGSGAPSNGTGSNGQFYFREDGTTGSSIYMKRSGSWVAIV